GDRIQAGSISAAPAGTVALPDLAGQRPRPPAPRLALPAPAASAAAESGTAGFDLRDGRAGGGGRTGKEKRLTRWDSRAVPFFIQTILHASSNASRGA